MANLRRHLATSDYVGHGKAPARLQDPKGLPENTVFVCRKVDDAVRNDDIHRVVGQRDVLNFTFQELDIFDSSLALVFIREREHFVGHVETVGFAGGADSFRGEQHIYAAARAEVKDDFAWVQVRERGWIPAAERGQHGFFRNLLRLRLVIKVGRDGIIASSAGRGSATRTSTAIHAQCGLSVFLLHDFFNIGLAHGITPIRKFE